MRKSQIVMSLKSCFTENYFHNLYHASPKVYQRCNVAKSNPPTHLSLDTGAGGERFAAISQVVDVEDTKETQTEILLGICLQFG